MKLTEIISTALCPATKLGENIGEKVKKNPKLNKAVKEGAKKAPEAIPVVQVFKTAEDPQKKVGELMKFAGKYAPGSLFGILYNAVA